MYSALSLHLQYHDWGESLEQGTEPPTAPWTPQHWLPTAPGVCSRCVCAFGLVNAEHKFRIWVTILGCMSFHLIFLFLCTDKFLIPSICWIHNDMCTQSTYHYDFSFVYNGLTRFSVLHSSNNSTFAVIVTKLNRFKRCQYSADEQSFMQNLSQIDHHH